MLLGAKVTSRKLVHWGAIRVCLVPAIGKGCKHAFSLRDSSYEVQWNQSDKPLARMECELDRTDLREVCGVIQPDKESACEQCELVSIGVPMEPNDFVAKAVASGHPKSLMHIACDGEARLIAQKAVQSDVNAPKRCERLQYWEKRKEQLALDEQRLKDSMPDYVKAALGDLQVLLFKEILSSVNFADKDLCHDLCEGFPLTGWVRDTGLFSHFVRPPQMDVGQLKQNAKYMSPLTDDTAIKAWEETEREVSEGWIWEDRQCVPEQVVIAKRFGLKQKEKIRVIDNGRHCGLNLTCGLPERCTLHGTDFIAAVLYNIASMCGGQGVNIRGKTFDLVSAYKHYPIKASDREFVRLGVFDPDSGQARVFGLNVLPFGATGSVAGFLRISAAIWKAGCSGVEVPWTAYYDDFPTFAVGSVSDSLGKDVLALFALLGIEVAATGKKAV